ncbi:MAG: Ribosomal protein [Fibrobacterota bacterium]|jgi:large subunit ribosomal protein L29
MKQQKAGDVRSMDINALTEKLTELKDNLFQKNLDRALNKLEDPSSISAIRKDIARVNTIITEKQRGIR